ncbi:transcription factor bHLH25-like [Cornus florida]|uniref:transcription factor bHLH25-like n=1 Tax=Cornus florida TaxID=4283 RepID=UPI002897C0BE|nr:transcription factor bHLH25-like [Cornus florida]XP_059653126.1 transcription factor bHLH25-like [Cornus florida]
MEISHIRGLAELGMEDHGFVHQWPMNSVDDFNTLSMAASFGDNLHPSFAHPIFDFKTSTEFSHTDVNRPMKVPKTNNWSSSKTDHMPNQHTAASTQHLHFLNSNYTNQAGIVKPKQEVMSYKNTTALPSDGLVSQASFGNQNYVFKACQGAKRISTSTRLSQTQDHIIAERKRREKLSQRFIALSAIVPGLKKMDKASVLGDAIKYLKQLQERVKTLEEQTRKKSMESVVFVKKYELYADGDNSSSVENSSNGPFDEPLPEIEARLSDKDVLIRIHCEKKKGVLEKVVAEVEKLHLSVVNSSVLTFGSFALDLTIIAQMDTEFCMTLKDLVTNLRSAFQLCM